MMKCRLLTMITLLLVSFFLSAQTVDDLVLLTEEFPPYNFTENNTLQGISVDVLVEILKISNSKLGLKDIKVVPWARGYNDVLNKKNICLFSMTKTEKRTNLFKWVGPIAGADTVLISLKKKNIKINSINDIKKYQIGVVNEDVAEQILLENGIPVSNLQSSSKPISIIKKMNKDRVDLWCYGHITAFHLLKQNNLNTSDYKTVYTLSQGKMYFALSKNVPDKIITQLQNAMDQLKKSGRYQQIIDKYSK